MTSGVARRAVGPLRIALMAVSGGIVTYIALSYLLQALAWPITDATSYWEAALRLRQGQPLYVAGVATEDPVRYLYAPWFAFAWVPLTFLPREPVFVIWSLVLLGASIAALVPLLQARTAAAWLAALVLGSFLIWTASRGNVQPLLILGLLVVLERRSAPLWVGVMASLKVVPIAYAVVWLARRQWRRAAMAAMALIAFVVPALLFNVADYATDAGARPPLVPFLPLQVLAVAGAAVATWRLARTPYRWLAASALAMLALPRFVEYNVTFALVGMAIDRTLTNDLR